MVFQNREEAGHRLALAMQQYRDLPDGVIVALPRGGVAVGYAMSLDLHLPLDVFITRKIGAAGFESWAEAATRHANELVATVAASLRTPGYTVRTCVATGEAAPTVVAQAKDMDLIVVATHGRHGLDRFLLGSISHAIVHRAEKPVLVIQ